MLKSSIRILLEVYILDKKDQLNYKQKQRLREVVHSYLARCENSYSMFLHKLRVNVLFSSNSKEYKIFSDFYHYILSIYADDCQLTLDKYYK